MEVVGIDFGSCNSVISIRVNGINKYNIGVIDVIENDASFRETKN